MSKWKQIVLGEMGYTYGGLTNKTIVDFGFGKPFIPYMNIFSNGKINPKFLVLVNIHPGERQNTVKYGDLFFTTSSETVEEVGMTSVLLDDIGEAYLNSFCFGFRLNNFDDLLPEFAPFLFRCLELRKKISLFGQGSTRYNLPKTELLAKLKIDLPTIPEQRKIAKILSTTDSVIEKTHAAIAKYKAIKQGILHDLFTRGIDIKTGKLRPKQKDAPELYKESELGWIPKEWDELVLDECCEILDHLRVPVNGQDRQNLKGDIPYYGANSLQGYINDFIFNEDLILIAEDGGNFEEYDTRPIAYRISGKSWVNNHAHILKAKAEYSQDYIFYSLVHKNIVRFIAGGTRSKLNKSELIKIPIYCPQNSLEQQKIAERLNGIDQKIQSDLAYLNKLQQIKSGLMADLLSGNKIVTA